MVYLTVTAKARRIAQPHNVILPRMRDLFQGLWSSALMLLPRAPPPVFLGPYHRLAVLFPCQGRELKRQ